MITTTERSGISRVFAHCCEALTQIGLARARARKTKALSPDAEAALTETREQIVAAIAGMQAEGIQADEMPLSAEIPLHLLDTPNTRRLLTLLEQALQAAEAVDAERGRTLPARIPTGPYESRGTDLAESIALLRLRVQVEVHGPSGSGRE